MKFRIIISALLILFSFEHARSQVLTNEIQSDSIHVKWDIEASEFNDILRFSAKNSSHYDQSITLRVELRENGTSLPKYLAQMTLNLPKQGTISSVSKKPESGLLIPLPISEYRLENNLNLNVQIVNQNTSTY